jgi:DNA-binding transcriptional regulator YiaG
MGKQLGRLKQNAWPPSWIKYFRRQVLHEPCHVFASHWCSEDGLAFSARTVEAWEQGRRTPNLFVRQAMTRSVIRLRLKGHVITLPDQ